MKTIYTLITLLLSSTLVYGQLNITDSNYSPNNPLNCANYQGFAANFYDDGGVANNYSPGMVETFTVCPDISASGRKIIATFGNSPGLTWDVHSSDSLFVFDGPNINSPLLGAYNSANVPGGFDHTSSWANADGCLTFMFVSDGANEGAGWDANIRCISPAQDIKMHMEAFINGTPGNDMFPLDTGYVDICLGDSVLLVAKPIFNYSLENTGLGYSQTLDNVNYLWEFTDGQVGPNNDSIWYVPSSPYAVFANLMITDSYPSSISMRSRIRLGTVPNFSSSGPLEDTICYGVSANLSGGITATDTAGVNTPVGSFQLGGTFAGITYLPDGSGTSYSTAVNMSGFLPGATVQSASDIVDICVNMEHSYLGDLEMWLTCPNGTQVTIFDAYAGGDIPGGGFGAIGTFLGEPLDNTTGGPGNGYEYCFSQVNNTWGDFPTEFANGNTIPTSPGAPTAGTSMNPNGIYEPEGNYSDFIGCPLNGNWTLNIKDNLTLDDGYIFEWGTFFDPSLFPDNETYQNTVVDAFWTPSPTIVSNPNNDTSIVVLPDSVGNFNYQFNIVDDFGCQFDTTLTLHVLDTLIDVTKFNQSLVCKTDSVMLRANATGTASPFDFAWEGGQGNDEVMADTAYYSGFENGVFEYPFTVTDRCGFVVNDTATITMNQTLNIDSLIQYIADCGMENGAVSGMGSGYTGTPKYKWKGPDANLNDSVTASVWPNKPSGWYYFTIKDDVCIVNDSIFLEQTPPPVADFTPTPAQGAAPLNVTFINNSDPATTYVWDFGNGDGTTVNDLSDQNTTYVNEGVYTVTLEITEGACSDEAMRTITTFFPMSYDIPNVFTPNGDGQNDFYTINAEYATEVEIVIVNRWGNVVFESTDLNFAWNGDVNNSGAECSDGTYFYQFTIKGSGGQAFEEQGFIQLVRDK